MVNWYMQYLALIFSLYEITVLHLNKHVYQMNQMWLIRQIVFSDLAIFISSCTHQMHLDSVGIEEYCLILWVRTR